MHRPGRGEHQEPPSWDGSSRGRPESRPLDPEASIMAWEWLLFGCPFSSPRLRQPLYLPHTLEDHVPL